MAGDIPIIDFQSCGLRVDHCNFKESDFRSVGDQIVGALSTVGFCYLKNHGVPDKLLQDCQKSSMEFFKQPVTFKHQFRRKIDEDDYTTGWAGVGTESTNPKRPGDLKETFDYKPTTNLKDWPEGFLHNFRQDIDCFFYTVSDLALRVLEVVAVGLGLEKDNDLMRSHSLVGKAGNTSEMRTLYYPPIASKTEITGDQVRLGEHFDFGSLTISFQDKTGGLEVCRPDGQYVPAVPMEGTCLVNTGECLQKWTTDKLIASKHRIMIPEDRERLNLTRQSLVLFLNPNDDYIIRCLDGSDKYPPTEYQKRLRELIEAIYLE